MLMRDSFGRSLYQAFRLIVLCLRKQTRSRKLHFRERSTLRSSFSGKPRRCWKRRLDHLDRRSPRSALTIRADKMPGRATSKALPKTGASRHRFSRVSKREVESGSVKRQLGWLRLRSRPTTSPAPDNLIAPLEGSLSFAIFTRLFLLSGVLPHVILQNRLMLSYQSQPNCSTPCFHPHQILQSVARTFPAHRRLGRRHGTRTSARSSDRLNAAGRQCAREGLCARRPIRYELLYSAICRTARVRTLSGSLS
jgi:hypothetical protein